MTEMTDTTATPRGERTREATDRKLMRATLQIAVDRGISGVTIEEVARRSGVAKTTIYRRYHNADELLAMDVVWGDSDKDLFVVTNEGFAKRTAISEYRLQGRNGLGIKAVQLVEGRGSLVGALVVSEDDQVMAIMKSGKVIRSNVDEVKRTGRNTQGYRQAC